MADEPKGESKGKDKKGLYLPGNKFWHERKRSGRFKIYETPDDLIEACYKYFDWADDNPLWEAKSFSTGVTLNVCKARAMTIRGLCAHIGMSRRAWAGYQQRDEFKDACELAEDIMFEQKFAGAAAGLFNAALIIRDLGLKENVDVDASLTVELVDTYEDHDPE